MHLLRQLVIFYPTEPCGVQMHANAVVCLYAENHYPQGDLHPFIRSTEERQLLSEPLYAAFQLLLRDLSVAAPLQNQA
jgi:hypothetical protein